MLAACRDLPDVLCLQEVHKWDDGATAFFADLGYTLVGVALSSTNSWGGVATLVCASQAQGLQVPLSPPPPVAVLNTVVSMVRDLGADPPEFYCVANTYWPPDVLRGLPGAVQATLRYLEDLGADVIVGDLNARHASWCPGITRVHSVSAAVEGDAPFQRGSLIVSHLAGSQWVVANDRAHFTRWPTGVDRRVTPTSPDVVLHRSIFCSTFVSFDGRNLTQCAGTRHPVEVSEGIMRAVSDHLPLFVRIESNERRFVPLVSRCPVVLYDKIEDWPSVAAEAASLLSSDPLPRDTAEARFAQVAGTLRRLVGRLPQRSRKSSSRGLPPPPPRPESLQQLGATAMARFTLNPAAALEAVCRYREASRAWLGQLRHGHFVELSRRQRKGPDWSRDLWASIRPKGVLLPPVLAYPGTSKPMGARRMAQVFVDLFASKHAQSTDPVCVAHCHRLAEERPALASAADPTHSPVSGEEVRLALRVLRSSQCADDTGIRPVLLRHLPPPVLGAIAAMFTAMLRESYVPREWREAQVIPLYKGNGKPRAEASSYRPVAITSLLCRLLEVIVKSRVLHSMEVGEAPLHPHQHGFRPGLSSEFCLAQIISSLREGSRFVHRHQLQSQSGMGGQRHYYTLAVAVDFTDAFCRVPIEVIVSALYRHRVPHELVLWIQAFLTDRHVRVFVGGRFSERHLTAVGCPQGSVLGPLVWALAMEDLLADLSAFVTKMDAASFPHGLDQPTLFSSSKAFHSSLSAARRALFFADGAREACTETFVLRGQEAHGAVCGFEAYADDLTIWAHWASPVLTATAVQAMLDVISAWAARVGVRVSSKTTASWFQRGSGSALTLTRPLSLRLDACGTTVVVPPPPTTLDAATSPSSGISVLGVHLDPALAFMAQARMVSTKVTEVTSALGHITGTMPPGLLSMVHGCLVGSRILYGIAAYWSTATQRAQAILRVAWHNMALYITGAVPSAREDLVLAEAGLRPLGYIATTRSLQLLCRALSLPRPRYDYCLHSFYDRATQRRHVGPGGTLRASHHYIGQRLIDDALQDPRVECWRDWIRPYLPSSPLQGARGELCRIPLDVVVSNLPKVVFRLARKLGGVPLPPKNTAPPELLRSFNECQMGTDPTCPSIDLYSDGSVEGTLTSGGAFMALSPDGSRLLQGTLSLGAGASSYTMERSSLRAGVVSLHQYLTDQSKHVPLVRVVTDSLSVLAELALGPFRQCEEECEDIWARLLTMPADQIRLIFVFSHVDGETAHSLTDKAALAARSASPTRPLWPRDVLRGKIRVLREAADTPIADSLRGSLGIEGPSKDLLTLAMPRPRHRELLRLRTGASPRLGGWQHVVEPCTYCNCPISRESMAGEGVESAVRHLFGVRGVSGCYYLPPAGLTVADLWKRPELAMAWTETFLSFPKDSFNDGYQANVAPPWPSAGLVSTGEQ